MIKSIRMHKKKAHDRAFKQSGLSKNRAAQVCSTRHTAAHLACGASKVWQIGDGECKNTFCGGPKKSPSQQTGRELRAGDRANSDREPVPQGDGWQRIIRAKECTSHSA